MSGLWTFSPNPPVTISSTAAETDFFALYNGGEVFTCFFGKTSFPLF
jgi:hypothetical protein